MRDVLLPLLLHGLLITAGGGVLRLTGVRAPGLGQRIALVGLAYLLGLTTVFAALQLGLAVGVPFSLQLTLGVAAVLTVPLLPSVPAVAARAWTGARGLTWQRVPKTPVAIGVSLTVLWLVALVASAGVPLSEFDAWAIWTHKATIMYFDSSIPVDVFASPAFAFAHPDYPLTMPLWEAAHFRALGTIDTSQVHALMWMLLPAWAGGAVALAPRSAPKLVVLPIVAATSVLLLTPLMTGYADAPLAMLLSLSVLALGRWLLEEERSDLLLGVVLLGGAAQLKNEGVLGGVVLLVALALVAWKQPRGLRDLTLAGLAWALVFVAPWKLWLSAHDIHGDLPLGKGLDPTYLFDRADRLSATWRWFAEAFASGGPANDAVARGGLLSVTLIAVVALVVTSTAGRRLRVFTSLALAGYTASLAFVYVISPYDIVWHLQTSASRVLVAVAMIGVSTLILLSATDDRAPRSTVATSTPDAVPDL